MSEKTTYDTVIEIVANQFNASPEELSANTRFKEDLQADSISVVELVMAFEDAFGQSISDEDSEHIATIQDVVAYIDAHQ